MTHPHPQQRLGKGMMLTGWVIGLILMTFYANQWLARRDNPNMMPLSSEGGGLRTVVLQRNPMHHYVTSGFINGQPVTFLVDTGATTVSVPQHLAPALGLQPGQPQMARTANGVVQTRATRIQEMSIGTIVLTNVSASINPGMTQDEILLGMSALKNVEFIHRDGTLTLNQYY